jgi:hypothetical protein
MLDRVMNIVLGVAFLLAGLYFLLTGITIFPIIGFMYAVPFLGLAIYFFGAPPSKACYL